MADEVAWAVNLFTGTCDGVLQSFAGIVCDICLRMRGEVLLEIAKALRRGVGTMDINNVRKHNGIEQGALMPLVLVYMNGV